MCKAMMLWPIETDASSREVLFILSWQCHNRPRGRRDDTDDKTPDTAWSRDSLPPSLTHTHP